MNIVVIGATGFVGKAIVNEALQRGHTVTAISRKKADTRERLISKSVDIYHTSELAKAIIGNDVVISAYNPGWDNPNIYQDFIEGSQQIQEAVRQSGVKRFIVIGGAGSLYIAPEIQLVNTPEFPQEYKQGALGARDYLTVLKQEQELDWTFFSPAIEMHQGITTGRTGHYRLGLENPVFDAHNRSILSVEDLAVAIIDEAEQAKHIRQRFTAAY